MPVREPNFLREILLQLNSVRNERFTSPLVLGGSSGSGGGSTGVPGGVIGQLGQRYIAADSDEFRVLTSGSNSSLVDNLNNIRYWETVQISSGSPSPTFPGQVWIDGSSGSTIKFRNETDSDWITVTSGSSGGGAVLDANSPQDVGATAVVGSSGSAAHGNHVHRGVHGIYTAPNTLTYGDIDLVAGSNMTITQSSGSFTFSSSGSMATPGTLSYSTTNNASGNHTHAITASSDPGVAESLLKTDSNGDVKLAGIFLTSSYPLGFQSGGVGAVSNVVWSPTGARVISFPDSSGEVAVGTGTLTASTGNTNVINHTHAIDSTIARAAITLTAGNGLTGGGDLSTNRTIALITPGTLTVATSNSSSGSHTHEITASSNPGAASSLLKSNLSGDLYLQHIVLLDTANQITLAGTSSTYGRLSWNTSSSDKAISLPNVSGTVTLGAGTLTVATTNSITIADHTHSITSSSSPGAAASLLSSDSSGNLQLVSFTSSGSFISAKNSTTYTGYIFVPLTTPLTSTSYDGNDTVTAGSTTTIDTSAVFGAPVGIKAALVRVSGVWTGVGSTRNLQARPVGGTQSVGVCRAQVANVLSDFTVPVPCDANGDFDLFCAAGENAGSVMMQIWGYWI